MGYTHRRADRATRAELQGWAVGRLANTTIEKLAAEVHVSAETIRKTRDGDLTLAMANKIRARLAEATVEETPSPTEPRPPNRGASDMSLGQAIDFIDALSPAVRQRLVSWLSADSERRNTHA